ncbi:hypothetical protein GCM10010211_42260 [Streptomyces albospinus]|uniref:DUF3995 domain-containing protein n=1 Tax=Streptomyces albospinus TaxID=285515 RepID=A0ABQ2VAQ9_9ACTN|nr:DUF3995 domain-containing protein [Streptomyces albospinus]GGU71977.1 hypothetical protein GCM10010211_42260 [Streptomyces albospinus]
MKSANAAESHYSVAWPGYAAAVWGFVFAIPSFYWALGGLLGAESMVSPSLVHLAEERDPDFLVVLWLTGILKVVGGLVGLALVRRRAWGRGMSRLLQLLAWGAGVLLVWHGALFVGQGLLVEAHAIELAPELRGMSRWYTYLWGPWFVAGGIAFLLAAWTHLGGLTEQRSARIAGMVGGAGALLLSVMALVAGIG